MAHEINRPLTYINAISDFTKDNVNELWRFARTGYRHSGVSHMKYQLGSTTITICHAWRAIQKPVGATLCRFDSDLRHQLFQA